MKLKLEDMSKEELIKIVHQQFKQPTEHELLWLRWESITDEARRIRDQALKESEKWKGDTSIEGYTHWRDAQLLFDKGMKLDDKADEVYKQMEAAGRLPGRRQNPVCEEIADPKRSETNG